MSSNPFITSGLILVIIIAIATWLTIWLQDRYQQTNAQWQEALSRIVSSVAGGAILAFIIGLVLLFVPKHGEFWYTLSNPNYEESK